MGLFDAFGVGGGSLTLQVQSQQVQAGGAVSGLAVFTAGRRAQAVTRVTVKLTCTRQVPQASGQLMQQTLDVVPALTVSGAFTSQSGQTYQFPFQFQVPADAYGSTPNLVTWRVSGNVDIDGEVDPGAGVELMVHGAQYQAMGMTPMGGPTHAPMPAKDPYAQGKGGDPYAKGGDPYAKGGDPYAKGGDPYAKGGDPYAKGGDPKDPYGKGGKH